MTFNCISGCSDCCGTIPINKEVVKRNLDKFQQEPERSDDLGDRIVITTKDLKCVFLTKNHKCAIYDERPEICRIFGSGIDKNGQENVLLYCPHLKPNGNKWSVAKAKHLKRRVNRVMKDTITEVGKKYGKN